MFGSEKYDAIYNRIRYLTSIKSGITYVLSHIYMFLINIRLNKCVTKLVMIV